MADASTTSTPSVALEDTVPALENGDRLTRVEFERRYDAMPHLQKAELIEGVVYVPSPVRHRQHGSPHANLVGWLFQYAANTPGIELGDNSSVRLDFDNEPQPDALLFIDPSCGGQVRISADGIIEGAPDLIAEVASSSVSYDLHSPRHDLLYSGGEGTRPCPRDIRWHDARRPEVRQGTLMLIGVVASSLCGEQRR